jgi:hypothetical protein
MNFLKATETLSVFSGVFLSVLKSSFFHPLVKKLMVVKVTFVLPTVYFIVFSLHILFTPL